ncbi:unnamed protein product [Kuraishia capsulata CBS 1993]|uniref:Kinesin-like protein n=1 Tax=Kuraishia capsulata CBS 1993 TaxID=1382522 RepID=W6MLL2_9ASCO|nr:uncharacterized protein KUCA_T00001702001 [Kuraishia capsulata CBS 1993]CDK25732.1 unnamed protein product [Kuraishia capsulata CBS 1993]
MSKESTITVAVRVRPLTDSEKVRLETADEGSQKFLGDGSLATDETSNQVKVNTRNTNCNIRKVLSVVDDRMLIFDPPESNFLVEKDSNILGRRGPEKFKTNNTRMRERKFVFDRLFDEDADQGEVFNNTTRPLLDSVLDGFNATVFAYGATGCGKTHTISGTPDDPGIIFLTMAALFQKIDERRDSQVIELTLSYLEIYNETIRDLLNPQTNGKPLILREDKQNHMTVANLTSHKPSSVEEVMDMILEGNMNRTVSPTEANATSSRSHAVLQINITQRAKTAEINEEHTFATLSIIDLAGSERASVSKNRGERFQEGANINKSLLALGNCINALCDSHKGCHVPYRNSKLTRLLKFSLGGNCKTVMIVCVSPSSQHYDETLNTLKYANRAKEIKTKLARNQHNVSRHVGSYLKMIEEQRREIAELKEKEGSLLRVQLEKEKSQQSSCQKHLAKSLDELKNSIANMTQPKIFKASLLARRRMLFTDRNCLVQLMSMMEKSEVSAASHTTKELARKLIEDISIRIKEIEKKYSQQSDLDTILEKTSKLMLRKLEEMEGWSEFYSALFNASVSLLKEFVNREILTLASISEDDATSPSRLFEVISLCLVGRGSSGKTSEEDANIFVELNESLDQFVKEGFTYNYSLIPKSSGSPQDKFSSPPNQPAHILSNFQKSSKKHEPLVFRGRNYATASPITKASKKTILKGLKSPNRMSAKLKKRVRWEIPFSADQEVDRDFDEDVSMEHMVSPLVMKSDPEMRYSNSDDMEISPQIKSSTVQTSSLGELRSSPLSGKRKIVPLTARTIKSSLTSQQLLPSLPPRLLSVISTPEDVVMKDESSDKQIIGDDII